MNTEGLHVKVLSLLDKDEYRVEFQGEIWNAYSKTPFKSGDFATIKKVKGLHLYLIPKEK